MASEPGVYAERLLPHHVEAEESVIGSLIIDGDAIHRLIGSLDGEDFYQEKHRLIWNAMLDLWKRSSAIDQITLARTLVMTGGGDTLQAIGGMAYLSHLVSITPTSVHIEHYAGIVRDAARQRSLIHIGSGLVGQAYDLVPPDTIIQDGMGHLISMTPRGHDRRPQTLEEVYSEYQADLVTEFQGDPLTTVGAATGFRNLDRIMNGWQDGLLYVMCARTSMGKTMVANALAMNLARRARPVFMFSLELPRKTLMRRMIFTEARVSSLALKDMAVDTPEREKAVTQCIDAMNEIQGMPITIDDRAGLTPQDIRATLIAHCQVNEKPSLVIIDYLNLMRPDEKVTTGYQAMSSLIKDVKIIGSELSLPLLVLAQLNRQPDNRPDRDRRPHLSDLRDAGTIEEVAQMVLGVYRQSYYYTREQWAREFPTDPYPEHYMDIDIMKQQEGATGTVQLFVDLPTGWMGDMTTLGER